MLLALTISQYCFIGLEPCSFNARANMPEGDASIVMAVSRLSDHALRAYPKINLRACESHALKHRDDLCCATCGILGYALSVTAESLALISSDIKLIWI
jgi:hypothetical protein